MIRVANALFAAVLLAAPAAAQRRPPVQEGARVRLELREPTSTWVGIALPSSPDSLVVRYPSGEVSRIPLRQIESLQVSGGTRSRWPEGTVLGAVVGIGAALLIEEVASDDFCIGWCTVPEQQDRHRAPWAIGGSLAGALIGGIVGSFRKAERWVSVPLDFRSP